MERSFIFCMVFLLNVSAFSQVSAPQDRRKSPQELQQLASRYAIEFAIKKAASEQKALQKGWTVRKEDPDGRIIEIMEIGPNGMPEYNTTDNLNAAKTTGTNKLWPGGSSGLNLTGAGFTIGEWDGGGVRTSHQEFKVGTGTSRVIQKDGSTPTSYHSTHVAGTLTAEGDAANARGMANAANLHAYDWDNDVSEMLNANAVDGITLSNHSYGRVRGWNGGGWYVYWMGDTAISRTEDYQFGFYGPLTKTWDSMAYVMQDFLFVKSAGNDRGESYTGIHYVWDETLDDWVQSSWPRDIDGGADGYDCIENRACAKNLLTVGAVEDIPGGYTSPADVVMSSFSGWGPTDDGRIKPDIVANGIDVYSANDYSNSDYITLSGTSMAAPNVCGTLALLQDYHFDLMGTYMYADELKALVINTAFEAGADPGPDYKFGWGLLNAKGAADLITLEDAEGHHIKYYTLLHASEIDEYLYYADGSEDINVTVAWVDPPHDALPPSLNPTTPHKVHDLDVRVVRVSTGGYYYPWKLNPASPASAAYTGDNTRDNVEKVTILSPAAGQYKILVSLSGSLTEDQFYALVVSGMEHVGVPGRWTGAVSDNWNTTGNWDDGVVPDISVSVTIPSGCPHYPVLTGSLGISYATGMTYVCDNLDVNTGGILTIQTYNLYSSGNIDLDGTVYVGNDVYLNNGSVLDLAGSLYTGYSSGYYGDLIVSAGATINQTGGNLRTEMINLASGCQYNGSDGYCRIYAQGSIPATQNIQVDDAESFFDNFYVESGTNTQMYDCSADLDVFNFDVNGVFNLNNYNVNADYADVYGTLTIPSGVFDVSMNGPYFHDGSAFNMSGGELNGNESIKFLTGATENVTGGDITLLGDLWDEDVIFTPTGGDFYFEGSGASNINGPTSFYNLYINKTYSGIDAVENGTGNGLGVDINVANNLNILDGSLELNSPCTLTIGNNLYISEGGVLNANDYPGVNILVAGTWHNSNLSGGFDCGTYSTVEFNSPVTTSIQIIGENNMFNDIIINSGAPYVRPSLNPGYGLIHARNIDITDGALNPSGKKVIVDETLNIFDGLTMIDPLDSLIVGDIKWKPGSVDAVSNGKILVNGSWTWEDGTNATITSGNLVRFIGNSTEYIYSYDANADFYKLDIDKGSYTVYIASASTQPVDVMQNMNVFSGSLFHVNTEILNVNGVLDVKSGASMILFNGSSVDLDGDFTLNGFVHLNTGGNFFVHGTFQEATTGHLNIQNGSFVCDKPYYAAKAIQWLHGTLTMGGGLFEVTHNHIEMSASFVDNITGGTIRTGGSFIAVSNVFQPSGTSIVELSNSTVPGTPYVDLNTGNWMMNLVVNGNTNWLLGGSGATTLTVKQDLTINSGSLEGGTGDLIYLGDDWTNNAGASGFIPGTSHLYLTGSNPSPDRQTISGTTTFYNMTNQDITNVAEFAGPVTVSNIYNAGAGGSACETFITGSPVNINQLILSTGTFALSTSVPTVNVSLFDQGGTIQVTNGILNISDIVETALNGSYIIYNGAINITQDEGNYLDIAADLYIYGGQINLSGGTDVSFWPISGSHVFEMTGGILDYQTLGIYMQNNNMTYNITGGKIMTVGDFDAASGITAFDPVDNEVELYGSNATSVNLGTGSWFHDLTINKTEAQVSATRAFRIKGELDLQNGTFNTNNYLITVEP